VKIASVEAIPLRAALSTPFRFANVVRTVSANVLVRICTDDDLVGWGEACPVPQLTGETQRSVVEVVDAHLTPLLLRRDPLRRTDLLDVLRRGRSGIDFTLAAIDMALLDVAGKAAGLPVAELLGGRRRDHITVHGSVGWNEDADAMADTARQQAQQFGWLKLYAGVADLASDLDRIDRVRAAVGADHPFLVDINGRWTVTEVARAAERLAAADVRVVEQPVAAADARGNATACRLLHERFGIDVVADESIRSPQDVIAVAAAGAATVINIGLSKLGGPTAAAAAAHAAAAAGLSVLVGGVVELGVANAAGLHLAALQPDPALPAYLMGPLKYQRQVTTTTISPHLSSLPVPDGPGLGVDIDPDALHDLDLRIS
jgi:L-alanine-DL-glutamate epimerase-like enolase superfamily enzyme